MTTVTFDDTAAGGQAPSTGAAAYACSRLGFRVFPLVPGTNLPALSEWPDRATDDVETLRDWWTGSYTGYGVGIACGPESGVWVLDIDVKGGVDGFASLRKLTSARGQTSAVFARTMSVRTPSGGAHVYFRWAEGVVNSTKRLGPGLDVRAERGYVRGPGWGGYDIVARGGERLTRIAAAPHWLVGLAQKRKSDRLNDALRQERPGTSWARFNTARALEHLGSAPEGTRNDALNKAAYRLGRSGSLSEMEAWIACAEVMVRIGAQDAEDAQRRTFKSGWNAGVAARGSA